MKDKNPENQIIYCVEPECMNRACPDNERCQWHSIKYYAGYWGKESVKAVSGKYPVTPEME